MRLNIQETRLKKAEILTKLIEVADLNDNAINEIVSYVFSLCGVPENSPNPDTEIDNISNCLDSNPIDEVDTELNVENNEEDKDD